MPSERRHDSAVSKLDVHQLEDIPSVATVAGIEEPLPSGLHIADSAVVLVNDDAAAPGRIVGSRVQEVEIVAPKDRRSVGTPVTRVLLEVLLNLLREVLAGPVVHLETRSLTLNHRGQQFVHQLQVPAGIDVLTAGHADEVSCREGGVDREVRHILHRGQRVRRNQNVLGAAS